jgi:16S rRNA (adenine1518-N6/adenine1519-N6)-dimethyltransferase
VTERRHRARRSLGQNFLVDPNLQRKIVAALGAGPDDTVLEIGPGMGALTGHLAGQVRRLILVELDPRLVADLEARYEGRADVEIVHADVLNVQLADLVPDPEHLKVVGNIPYNITSPIIFHLLERPRPERIVLMVQKEVAQRVAAGPGPDSGALSIGVQSVAEVRTLFGVPRGAFRPVPRVDSAVIEIVPRRPAPLTPDEEQALRTLTRLAFQWRRKQITKILRDHPDSPIARDRVGPLLEQLGLDPERRPETFSVAELLAIAREFA